MNIDKIDKNFRITDTHNDDMILYDIEDGNFDIYGVFKENESFVRMSADIAKSISEGVEALSKSTSGGRIRFKTNSEFIFLKCEMPYMNIMSIMPFSGSSGFDLYADGEFAGKYIPSVDAVKKYVISESKGGIAPGFEYSGTVKFNDKRMRDIVINFPLYNAVNKIYIGLSPEAVLQHGNKYSIDTPVVLYGSSITQGGCVSRPGNVYGAVLSRKFDFDFINLGFSGNAKAEPEMAKYIANLNMSAFIYDYDCNAPDTDFYRNTHYRMYKIIRDKNPSIPIIMATRPSICAPDKEIADGFTAKQVVDKRIAVANETFERAVSDGDSNVYFVNGMDMFNLCDSEMMTVDGCHPNDFGSYCMAKSFENVFDIIKIHYEKR